MAQDAPQVLTLIHEQADAGRDLTQLLSDVISHLRNLLLAQADPDGLVPELGAELVAALQSQCANIERERLLELIDLFASAEQRMKWAANKQMHLEVAMLRAIHAVSQVTLSEVIDTLTAIREGREPAAKKPAPHAPVALPKPKPPVIPSETQLAKSPEPATRPPAKPAAKPLEKIQTPPDELFSGVQKQERKTEGNQTVPRPHSKSENTTVQNSPVEELAAPRVAEPAANSGARDPSRIWPELVTLVRQRRPLISMWIESGALLSVGAGKAVLGFSKDQNLALDFIQQSNNKIFLEEVLTEIVGAPTALLCEKHDSVELVPVEKPAVPQAEKARDPMEEFKDDPLIRKALELFKARLESN
jgi:DNA polymerase-3 subunit gamma/tau